MACITATKALQQRMTTQLRVGAEKKTAGIVIKRVPEYITEEIRQETEKNKIKPAKLPRMIRTVKTKKLPHGKSPQLW